MVRVHPGPPFKTREVTEQETGDYGEKEEETEGEFCGTVTR